MFTPESIPTPYPSKKCVIHQIAQSVVGSGLHSLKFFTSFIHETKVLLISWL